MTEEFTEPIEQPTQESIKTKRSIRSDAQKEALAKARVKAVQTRKRLAQERKDKQNLVDETPKTLQTEEYIDEDQPEEVEEPPKEVEEPPKEVEDEPKIEDIEVFITKVIEKKRDERKANKPKPEYIFNGSNYILNV